MKNIYRKHPRVYDRRLAKKEYSDEEAILNISACTAVGILAAAVVNGMVIGYMIRRSIDYR